MSRNELFTGLKGIKEQTKDKAPLRRAIPIILSVWIIGLTIYQCCFVGFFPIEPLHFNTISLFVGALKRVSISGSHITNILYALGFNLMAMLIGSRILRWLKVEPDSITTRLAFAIPIGLGIYSIGVFLIGICGLLYKEVVCVFLVFLAALSLSEMKPFLKDWRESVSSGASKIDYLFLPLIGLFVIMPLFVSFSPIACSDPLLYHMALPKIYLAHHGITYEPYSIFSTWPANTEMLYLLGLLISGESLSQLFSFSISLAFLFALFSFGKRFFSKTVGYLCVVIFLLIPTFATYISQLMVDTNFTLYAFLGIFAFLIWIEKKRDEWLYLSAICCGFAGAIKFHGLFFVLAFFISFFLTVKRDAIWGRRLFYCVLATGVVVLPWYVRSWILTGNPVLPFFYNFFGGKNWNEYSNLCYVDRHSWFGFREIRNLQELVTVTKWLFFSNTLGPGLSNPLIFFIFLIPGLICFKGWNKTAWYLFFIALAHYIFSLLTSPQTRYIFPYFAVLSIMVAYIITMIWSRHVLLKVIIVLSLVSFIFVGLLKTYKINERPFFTGLGVISAQEFLKHRFDSTLYDLSQWANKNLTKDAKILLWTIKGYFLDKEYVWIDPAYQGLLDFGRINNSSEFLTAIKKLNITHILYFPNGLAPTPSNLPHQQFLKLWHQELVDSGKIGLLKQIGDSGIYALVPPDYFVLDGNTISFHDESQHKYLVKGWSSTEEWGTWSEGEESVILINLKKLKDEIASSASGGLAMTNNRDYIMLIKATGFSVPGKQQSVKIYLDDNLLGEHTFTHPVTHFEDIEVKIPSAYIKESNQRIKFVYSFTGSPVEYGMGPDVRQLAMGVSTIEFR